MRKNKNILITLLLIVIVAIAGYLLYSKNQTVPMTPIETPQESPVVYDNREYGFTFALPDNWKDYSIVKETWQGTPIVSTTTAQTGPKLLIRNPKWTATLPYQDIPILVFTLAQWDLYVAENFAISAAPIQATELGRNNRYVFALPPRWDFDYSKDYEDAQNILKTNPLKTYLVE